MPVATPPRMPLSLDRLLELVDAAQQGVGVFDQTNALAYANDCYRRLLHIPAGELPCWRTSFAAPLAPDRNRIATADFEAWAAAASRRGRLPFRAFEADLHDGCWTHVARTTLANGSAMTPATCRCATSPARSQGLVRREDAAARWGGEFLLLLRDIDADAAHDVVGHMLASARQGAPAAASTVPCMPRSSAPMGR